MRVVYASNGLIEDNRTRVKQYLAGHRDRATFSTIDIGGGQAPWAGHHVDVVVDIREMAPDLYHRYTGDICAPETLGRFSDKQFDFAICTHTLEDVRDPIGVLRQIRRIAKAGFIATPSKHVEFSAIESRELLGYSHHRWIFTLRGDGLFVVPKFPAAQLFHGRSARALRLDLIRKRIFERLMSAPLIWRLARFLRHSMWYWPETLANVGPIGWIDRARATMKYELGFIWEGDLEFSFVDFVPSGHRIAELYATGLAEGL